MKIRESVRDIGLTLAIYSVLMVCIVFFLNNYYLVNIDNVFINILLTVSLGLTVGFLGQLTLGHSGFMAIGAYTSAVITTNLSLPPILLFPVAIFLSGVMAAFFGILIGIPALRLKGDYLAIITLGFNEIIRNVIQNIKFLGGAKGFKGIPRYAQDVGLNSYLNFSIIFFVTAISIIIIKNFIKTRQGRAVIAIREDEIAAEASGINTTYYKIFAFSMSAFFAGIAGSLYAHHINILDPTKFDYNYSIEMLIMVVLGGMGNIVGSILSATFLTILSLALSDYAKYRLLIYSILLIAVMLVKFLKPEWFDLKGRFKKTKGGKKNVA